MATEFCQKCKQAHPGRECDYDDKGECAESADITAEIEVAPELKDESAKKQRTS